MLRNPIDRAGCAIAVAITAIGYAGGIRPVVAHQTQRIMMERDIASKQGDLEQLRGDVVEKEAVVQTLQRRVGDFRTSFEASPRLNERIGELAALAEVTGVAVGSIRPGEPTAGDGVRQQPVSISGQGAPGDIARFLSQLRVVFPDMGVRSFTVSGQSAETSLIAAELVWFTGSNDQSDSEAAPSR